MPPRTLAGPPDEPRTNGHAATQTPARQARSRGRRPRSRIVAWTRRVLLTAAAVILAAAAAVGVLWPLTPSVSRAGQRVRAELAAHHARMLAALPRPDRVGRAIIATENSRFSTDPGIDPLGVLRAANNLVTGGNLGTATIEQQLAKRLYTPHDASLAAKIEDVELSFKLDARYSKADILRLYLSDVYFGAGAYGLPAAARRYFGLTPARLSWAQAALLAGLLQAPSAYDPYRHPRAAKLRQRHVLDRLVATGVLTAGRADAAATAPLHLRRVSPSTPAA